MVFEAHILPKHSIVLFRQQNCLLKGFAVACLVEFVGIVLISKLNLQSD